MALFYIHVPKTGGSTVNAVLNNYGGPGYSHCEHNLSQQWVRSLGDDWAWLSGHVTIDQVQEVFGIKNDKISLFSSIRHPERQVASHVNWLAEIYYKEYDFFYNHPEIIQKISFELLSNQINKFSLMKFLLNNSGLLLNTQSRYIAPKLIEHPTPECAREALKNYKYVANTKQLEKLYESMGIRLGWDVCNRDQFYVNATNYSVPLNLFYEPEVREFLYRHNYADLVLYEVASQVFDWDIALYTSGRSQPEHVESPSSKYFDFKYNGCEMGETTESGKPTKAFTKRLPRALRKAVSLNGIRRMIGF